MVLLSVDQLVVRFRTNDGTIHAVNGVTFELDEGETLGLVGESGCGKSVTSLAILRLLPKPAGRVEGGRVVFDGQDLLALSESEMREMRGRDVAMIFQDPMTSLNPVLTIEEQMVETIRAHRQVDVAGARARAIELLGMVGIARPETRLKSYPHEFSGGMRQRVMIAMALALEPKLLIADEPTTALDVTIQAQVLELLRRLTDETGTAAILITHDLGVVAGMTQRINVMYAGYIVEAASTADLFARPSHPYTVGLLHSIPRLDAQSEALIPIEGAPPDQRVAPTGCPFAPRCAWRLEVCWEENPALEPVEVALAAAGTATSGTAGAATSSTAGAATSSTVGEATTSTVAGSWESRDRRSVTHRTACHNPPTPDEAASGRPLREGFVRAMPPGGPSATAIDELATAGEAAAILEGTLREAGPISAAPSAAGLPLQPDDGAEERR